MTIGTGGAYQGSEYSRPVRGCVAVVVDANHPRFGEVAGVDYYDWIEYGDVGVRFDDGEAEALQDGMLFSDAVFPQVRIFRMDDGESIRELRDRLPEVQDKLRELTGVNHKRITHEDARRIARMTFNGLLSGDITDDRLF